MIWFRVFSQWGHFVCGHVCHISQCPTTSICLPCTSSASTCCGCSFPLVGRPVDVPLSSVSDPTTGHPETSRHPSGWGNPGCSWPSQLWFPHLLRLRVGNFPWSFHDNPTCLLNRFITSTKETDCISTRGNCCATPPDSRIFSRGRPIGRST